MNEFWDDLIQRKYTTKGKFYDLHIIYLSKFKSGNYNQYFGYGPDYEYMVNVCYYVNDSGPYIGLGKGIVEYEADNMTSFKLNINKELNDKLIINILKNTYGWKIDHFFNLCE